MDLMVIIMIPSTRCGSFYTQVSVSLEMKSIGIARAIQRVLGIIKITIKSIQMYAEILL